MLGKLWNEYENVHRVCRILFLTLAIAAFIGLIKVIIDEILPYYNLNKIEGLYSNYSGLGVEKIRINIAIIIAVGCIWMRSIFQKIALLCLIWVVFEYIWWWFTSYNLFTSTNNEIVKSMSGFLFLYGGQWWDIVILVIVIANLICVYKYFK